MKSYILRSICFVFVFCISVFLITPGGAEAKQKRIADENKSTKAQVLANKKFAFINRNIDIPGNYTAIDSMSAMHTDFINILKIIYSEMNARDEFRELFKSYQNSYVERSGVSANFVPPVCIHPYSRITKPNFYPITYTNESKKTMNVKHFIDIKNSVFLTSTTDEILITIAKEVARLIYRLDIGMSDVELDYREDGIAMYLDVTLKYKKYFVEMLKNGDPQPNAYWKGKITNPNCAFEEGYLELFQSVLNKNSNIENNDFAVTKTAYAIRDLYWNTTTSLRIPDEKRYQVFFEPTNAVKTYDQLISTGSFVAKLLHRITISMPDAGRGHKMILKIMSNDRFIKKPDLESFLTIFASGYPEEYSIFMEKFMKEFEAALADKLPAGSTKEQEKMMKDLVSGIGSLLKNAKKSGGRRIAAERDDSASPDNDAQYRTTDDSKASVNEPVQSLKINEINSSLKNGTVTEND